MEFESIDVETYQFDVVRKGYDRLQVEDFLNKISKSMARLEERRKLAEVRTEQAQRELEDVRTRAAKTIQETVVLRAQEIAPGTDPTELEAAGRSAHFASDRARLEAQQIIAQATNRASSIHAEAEAILAGALTTSARIDDDRSELLGSVDATRSGLIAAAAEEAEAIRTAAIQEAERTRAEAAIRAEETRERAESEATELLSDARARSLAMTATAERQSADLLASAERSHLRRERAERAGGDPLVDPITSPAAWTDTEEQEEISIDLREGSSERELEPVVREPRASRYQSRSANLPHIGDDAGSVNRSLGRLRTPED